MEVDVIRIKKAELGKVPEADRRILIEQLILLDEISAIWTAAALSYVPKALQGATIEEVQMQQVCFFHRLLTARLHEAWQRLQHWPADETFRRELGKEANESWDALRATFGTHGDVFAEIRNKFMFHYDPSPAGDPYDVLSDNESITLWMEPRTGLIRNDIFGIAAAKAAMAKMGLNDSRESFEKYHDLVTDAARHFLNLLSHWALLTLKKHHVKPDKKAVNLPDVPAAFFPALYDVQKFRKDRSI